MPDIQSPPLEELLERFRLTEFRPGQREVIEAVLAGHDCLCIMPTGGGKSLCYQLPALAREGVTLVISPLIALMKDQVDALSRLGIPATFVNSSVDPNEQGERLRRVASGELRLLYVAPERFRSPRFVEALAGTRVQLMAVDEAHCVSEWGHDFRPDYARIGWLRKKIGNPQTIALTATATPTVRTDVAAMLQLRSPQTFVTGFARPNLAFEVQAQSGEKRRQAALLQLLAETPGSGIVYASTRKKCEEVAELIAYGARRKSGVYHAGLDPDERRRVQDEFMSGRREVIVATNAFGMGIDKADLRFVIHYNLPGSIEAYYQESGRAGRDGKPSRCALLYSSADHHLQEFFIDNAHPSQETLAKVYRYLQDQEGDPIERTRGEIKEALGLRVGEDCVGACEVILERCGALERLEPRQNQGAVRLASDAPTLLDFVPSAAKVRRRVLQAIETLVGPRRHERVFFNPRNLAEELEMEPAAMARVLRELNELEAFDYVPPFRGRAVHLLKRDKPLGELGIDFAALEARRDAEYAKLARMISFATTARCRQWEILTYFGDPQAIECGTCDNCQRRAARSGRQKARGMSASPAPAAPRDPSPFAKELNATAPADDWRGELRRKDEPAPRASESPKSSAQSSAPSPSEIDDDPGARKVRIALSGVARCGGRFGKIMVAQMLCGSKSSKIAKAKLDQLSTYGLLRAMKQDAVVELLDDLLSNGLIAQTEIDSFRPIVMLTDMGREVMRGTLDVPERFLAPHAPSVPPPRPAARPAPPVSPATERAPLVSTPALPRPSTSSDPLAAVPPANRPSWYWTWRLLASGLSAAEVAAARGTTRQAVADEAWLASEAGLAVDVGVVLAPDVLAELARLPATANADNLSDYLESLPATIRLEEALLYLCHRERSAK